jgi:hypothetical protein
LRRQDSLAYYSTAVGNTPPKPIVLTLKLPATLERALAREAQRRGVSKSEVAREALARFVAEPEPRPYSPSALDLAGDLVGCIRGGPEDLSSDPRYLDDFGSD